MLYLLFECGKTFAVGFLLNDYFRRNYPTKHNEFCIDIAFNIIYVYSYFQIICNNVMKYLPQLSYLLDYINTFNIKKMSTIHFIKNNSVVLEKSFLQYSDFETHEYDFIVCKDCTSNPNNMKIIRKTDNINDNCIK